MDLTTVLDTIQAEKSLTHQRVSIDIGKLVPVPYSETDLLCECEHGTKVTEYTYCALCFISGAWLSRHHTPITSCIFVTQKETFDLIDGKARALAAKLPKLTINEVLRKVVTI